MKTSNIKKYFIFAIVSLCVFIAGFFFLYKKIEDNKKIAINTEVEWYNETTNQDKINILNDLLKDIDLEHKLFDSHFPQSSDIVAFLDEIEKIALLVNAKATINTVDPAKEETNPSIGIRVVGSFDSVYRFLILLENNPYQLEIVSFSMQQINSTLEEESIGGPVWNANFRINLVSFSR